MDAKALPTENVEKDKVIEVLPDPKPNQYILAFIQKTIEEQLDRIDNEILQHEKAIKELETLYTAHVHFLEHYSPFAQRNLSQELKIEQISPEALPQAERGTDEKSIRDSTQ